MSMKDTNSSLLANQEEAFGFLRGALTWRGSVTSRVAPGLLLSCLYPLALVLIDQYWAPLPHLNVTPFEYTGVVLGLLLVFRVNAGHDRWWEGRRLWGGIVNASRNIMLAALNYGPENPAWRRETVKWTIAYAFACKESLRQSKNFADLETLLSAQEIQELQSAQHMPIFVAAKMAKLFDQAYRRQDLNETVFKELERQRTYLIDHIGGCERILKTPMPLVLAIKARRFILLFLLLLPFSLIEKTGFNSILVFLLVAYPLVALDRIGFELQNPFGNKRLSHLPLSGICATVLTNGLALQESEQGRQG
ncbi:bestrophin family ion channel [Methylomicrobium sp. Wu6]|uniref:bestrophin family protein n=1 Tax=Methylomicrobium sp. Wu6 TaxID=3107928 RepID=UPI002DD688F7|nr:bestrophin family ion channel [Methylomicrobium sp. Wu6]MEC4749779.1 bestrophin family ion channel [Methylomicrobium sp. Wu6]